MLRRSVILVLFELVDRVGRMGGALKECTDFALRNLILLLALSPLVFRSSRFFVFS
jgi:hypothetical protein